MRRRRPGYTLLEVLLVLALLVILGAMAYPSIDGMYAGVKMRAGADGVRAALLQARAHAMDEARPYRFAVVPGAVNYRVAPDSPDYWGGEAPAPADPSNPPLVLEDSLPNNVVFVLGDAGSAPAAATNSGPVDPSAYVPVVTFLPEGNASSDVEIALRVGTVRPLIVRVRGMTGTVTVHPANGG